MNSGIYTAYSGMQAQVDALDIIANNLANINTTGFKEDKAFYTMIQESVVDAEKQNPLYQSINNPVQVLSTLNGKEGSLTNTYRDLDIAIEGNGFLVVKTPGGIRYTRNGSLHKNSEGVLSTADGSLVLGQEDKKITLGPGKIQINELGEVKLDGKDINRMKLVRFDDLSSLEKEGSSLFVSKKGRGVELASDAVIRSGFLEQSNVNPVASVVRMISILRHFEAMQKSMNMITNEINKQAIEKLGR